MNTWTNTRMEDRGLPISGRMSVSLIGTLSIAALLLLSVQLGCGNASSASSSANLESKVSENPKAERSTPTLTERPTTKSTPEVSSTAPATESPAASNSVADAADSTPTADSPDQAASENSGSTVRPMTVALVNAEQAAEPAKKPKPATEDPGKTSDPNRTNNYSFDDLKFDIEKDAPFERSMLPKKIEDYAGQRVSIRGFILPTSFQSGLTSFVLVRDNMECCFGPGAALYDCIVVEMADGKSTDYSIRPVTVEGKFAIEEFIGPGRRHLAIYKIVADKVE